MIPAPAPNQKGKKMKSKIVALCAAAIFLAGCDDGTTVAPADRDAPVPRIGFTYNGGKMGWQPMQDFPLVIPFDGSSPGLGWAP